LAIISTSPSSFSVVVTPSLVTEAIFQSLLRASGMGKTDGIGQPVMSHLSTVPSADLMTLRYGEKFGSRADSCWRLLFVHAMMS
jgi:hypothetical protein